jgi:hypothetical protein
MKRGLLFVLLLFLLPIIMAITGEVSESPTDVSVFVLPGFPVINIYSPENTTYLTTNILLNYSISNNFSFAWYNIDNSSNISLPNATNYSTYFNSSLGDHILNLYANNTYGANFKSISFKISNTPPSSSSSSSSSSGSSSGGGGGGGGGAAGVISLPFEITPKFLEVQIVKGESKKESIEIKNTGTTDLNLQISTNNLDNFALIDENELVLKPGETKQLGINFFTLSKIQEGIYVGKVIFTFQGQSKEVNVFIDLKNPEALFDVSVSVLSNYKKISQGEKASVLIDMTNIGLSGKAVDVELSLYLADSEKKLVSDISKETIAVKTDLSITRKVVIPANLEDGVYLVIAEIKYNNLPASSYDTIEVKKENGINKFLPWLYFFIAAILTARLIYIIINKKKNNKKIKSTK